MNAEQLHSVSRELRDILISSEVISSLNSLQQALQNLVNSPQQPQHQVQVQEERKKALELINRSGYDNWPTNRFQISQEIGAQGLFGKSLTNRIAETFSETVPRQK